MMRKHLGWWVAALLAVGLALVEWRPWDYEGVTAVESTQEGVGDGASKAFATGSMTSGTKVNAARASVAGSESQPVSVIHTEPERPAIRAQLSPLNYTTMTAELGAKVQELPFKEGDAFVRGDVLVRFDCSVQQAQLARVRATLAIAARNASTNARLLKLGSISRVEAENSYSELTRAEAEVKELEAIVSKCQIDAPFNGKVVEQRVRSQQFLQVGQPLLDILDSSGLELELIAPSKWAPWLKVGHVFEIHIDETGKTYPAKVTRVGARIDSVSQTFKVAAIVDGEYTDLSPGMSGTISVNPPEGQGAL